ncbi:MAG: CPBP family intramembrane metalloprotease [Eudoraea sp.]|nr:CPBP family intramembrane metalloprotease [Eudoraea sp.]NNJ39505.1 CPBP family intramembrane metalloprotease [Eudoraea sp.]
MIKEVWEFLKRPRYEPFLPMQRADKIRYFIHLLAMALAFSFFFGIFGTLIAEHMGLVTNEHAMEKFLENSSASTLFVFVVILAPALEELIFRAPLALFKKVSYFPLIFYLSVLLFGAVHLLNFEYEVGFYGLAIFLILPQLSAGVFLGFIRVKMGLGWAILLHAFHNFMLLSPFLLLKLSTS